MSFLFSCPRHPYFNFEFSPSARELYATLVFVMKYCHHCFSVWKTWNTLKTQSSRVTQTSRGTTVCQTCRVLIVMVDTTRNEWSAAISKERDLDMVYYFINCPFFFSGLVCILYKKQWTPTTISSKRASIYVSLFKSCFIYISGDRAEVWLEPKVKKIQ